MRTLKDWQERRFLVTSEERNFFATAKWNDALDTFELIDDDGGNLGHYDELTVWRMVDRGAWIPEQYVQSAQVIDEEECSACHRSYPKPVGLHHSEAECAQNVGGAVPLQDTVDASVWAREFCKLNTATDEGTMIGWFANAIEAGKRQATREAQPSVFV